MNQKGFINILLVVAVLAVILLGIGVYFVATRQTFPLTVATPSPGVSLEPTLTPASTPTSTPTSTLTPTPKPSSTHYGEGGSCPPGYVDYGIPLQCVTPEYLEYCQTHPCPICLSKSTKIATPLGALPVEKLRKGMPVWTANASGAHVLGIILKVGSTPAPLDHQMVQLILADGRTLFVSPGHPTIDGRTVGELAPGDVYDKAKVISTVRFPYGEDATYDILPSGATGFYWANGILLGSTLR